MDQDKIAGISVKWGLPETFGWVRAQAHDDARFLAYERPDGAIVRAPRYCNFICCKVGAAPAIVKVLRQSED